MEVRKLTKTSRNQKAIRLFKNPKGSKIKTFAIFTGENPNRIPSTPAENREYNKQVEKRLKGSTIEDAIHAIRYSYKKVKGKYGNNEHSYLVMNIALSDVKNIAEDACQESFIFGMNDDGKLIFQFWRYRGSGNWELVDETSEFTERPEAQKDFTQISRKYKFNLEFGDLEDLAETYINYYDKRCNDIVYAESMDKWLNDSVDDKLNFSSRYLCRIDLYGKKNK